MEDHELENRLSQLGAPIVIASFPRSGTHLTIDLIRKQFPSFSSQKRFFERQDTLYLDFDRLLTTHIDNDLFDGQAPVTDEMALNYLQRSARPIIKTHALPDFSPWFGKKRVWIDWLQDRAIFFYVFRDGRDVICSYQHLVAEKDPSANCEIGEFMRQKRNTFVPNPPLVNSVPHLWAEHMAAWIRFPKANLINLALLAEQPRKVTAHISGVIGEPALFKEPLLPKRPKGLWSIRFERAFYRKPESSAILTRSFLHKKTRWQNVFTEDDESYFQKETTSLEEFRTKISG